MHAHIINRVQQRSNDLYTYPLPNKTSCVVGDAMGTSDGSLAEEEEERSSCMVGFKEFGVTFAVASRLFEPIAVSS